MTYKARCKLGDNILDQMVKQKITSNELALRTGLSRISISHYLNAHHAPRAKHIYSLATALGCRVHDLLKGIETEEML